MTRSARATFAAEALLLSALAAATHALGCSHDEASSGGSAAREPTSGSARPTPSSSPGPAPVPASSAAPSAPGSSGPAPGARASTPEGAHDYRGTLGRKTSIALHLVRTGSRVDGSYVYTAMGHSIPFDGTIDANGAVVVSEKVGGKTTGTLRLRTAGDGLVGEWSDPAGGKTLPLRLAPGAPWKGATVDAGAPTKSASARAEECLADATCSAAEAARLFVSGDDAHDRDVDCFRFIDGSGTARDLKRGRACFERTVKRDDCEGASADLPFAELALLYIDGVGGKSDVAAGRAVLAGCMDDATRDAVSRHAAAREHDPKIAAMDFCKQGDGTTLALSSCLARDRTNEETRGQLQAKIVAAGLDDAGKKLVTAAQKAYASYADAMGSFAYQVFVQGSIRNTIFLARERELYARWTTELTDFARFVAKETTPADVDRARANATRALAAVTTSTPEEKEALQKTRDAWSAFRDADVALYEAAFGAKQGKDKVRAAVTVQLESRRAGECAPPSAK